MIGGKNWINVFVSEPNVGIQKLVQRIVFVRGVLQTDMTTFLRVRGKLRHGNQTDSMIRVIVGHPGSAYLDWRILAEWTGSLKYNRHTQHCRVPLQHRL
jgi:hypothetical protein